MAITANTDYNPIYHSCIVGNFRRWWTGQGFNEPLMQTDSEIFALWRDHYCDDDSDYEHGLYGIMREVIVEDMV